MFKAVLSNSFVTLLVFGCSFLFKAYLTHSVSSYSLISFYIFADFVALVMRTFVGYKDCLVKLRLDNDKMRINIFFVQFKLLVIIGVVFLVIPIYYYFFIAESLKGVSFILMVSVAISTILNAYFLVRATVEGEYGLMTISEVLKFGVYTSSLFLLLQFIHDLHSMFYALILSNLSVVFLVYFKSKNNDWREFKLSFSENIIFTIDGWRYILQIVSSSIPYFVNGVMLFIPVYLLMNYGSESELADYQVVARSVYMAMLAVFVYPLNRILLPEFFMFFKDKEWGEIKKIKNKVIMLTLVFLIIGMPVCYYMSPVIIGGLFDDGYINSSLIVSILFLAIPMQFMIDYSMTMIKATSSFHMVSFIYLVGIIVMLCSSMILYPNEYWVHYSFVISSLIVLLLSEVVSYSSFKKYKIRSSSVI